MGSARMKVTYDIRLITKEEALEMIKKYHYSNTLPKINKAFVGFFLNDQLVGVVTLGWGTRPLHTIRLLFPSLTTKDYFEIGRMCMADSMERNSESQMLSQLVAWMKMSFPDIKVLFTWADGMLGKPGYVYQASNFWYAGYSETDIYLKDGVKIHPRQTRQLFADGKDDKRKTVRPTKVQRLSHNITHYMGRQYRYVLFLCDKRTESMLRAECTVALSRDYPKDSDLVWRVKDESTDKWIASGKPPYVSDTTTPTDLFSVASDVGVDISMDRLF